LYQWIFPAKAIQRPFRFQAAWLSYDKSEECLRDNWNIHMPLYLLLHHLSNALKKWNKKIVGNLFRRRKELWSRIEGIQRQLAIGHNRSLIKLKANLRCELDNTLDQIETLWFQKSRMEAIKDGDKNTRYYHLSTIIGRRHNKIEALQDPTGNWIWNEDGIKSMVSAYFKNLYIDDAGDDLRT